MPYDIRKQGGKWCVYGPSGNHGCHETRAGAIKQQRALYARAPAADETIVGFVPKPGASASEAAAAMEALAEGAQDWPEAVEAIITMGGEEMAIDVAPEEAETQEEERGPAFRGPIAIEAKPTSDGRVLMSGEIDERAMPVPLNVQIQTSDGHDQSFNAGRLDEIIHVPFADVPDEDKQEFGLEDLPETAVVIFGTGTFDTSEYADEAQRMLSNGAGVSIDMSRDREALLDPETLQEIDTEGMDPIEVALKALSGEYLRGLSGKIGGATVVTMAAFEEATIKVIEDRVLVASAYGLHVDRPFTLTAAAGPLRPPKEWFENPNFRELTPLTITKEGQVFGHLADWDGCHIGFQGICVPPFRSASNYGVFNASCGAGIETADGSIVPCGKIMFSRAEGIGHAPTDDPTMTYQDVQRWYDDATKVGAYVKAGQDRFGTWLAGSLRSDLTDLEIQHLRTHPPSGDWRPVKGTGDLVAAFAVPVGGFPIVQRQALVASADGEIAAIITAPLQLSADHGARRRRRRKIMLSQRLREIMGHEKEELTRTQMRLAAMKAEDDGA